LAGISAFDVRACEGNSKARHKLEWELKEHTSEMLDEDDEDNMLDILFDKVAKDGIQRLASGQEISACASVSKRWLTLISNIRKDEIAESNGYLSRCLVGWKITDVGLEAIVVGTANIGGLAKLSIWGNNLYRGMTDVGLKCIA
ncbi:hypothetical protein MTR67_001031, partial [Solanum verrucosum]